MGRFVSALVPQLYQTFALAFLVGAVGALSQTSASLDDVGAMVLLLLRALSYGQQAQASVHSLNEVAPYLHDFLDERDLLAASAESTGDTQLGPLRSIELEDVSFEYKTGRPVLSHLSFRIDEGEMIGVVGPSGAASRRSCSCCFDSADRQSGQVLIDGTRADSYSVASWVESVAYVPQDGA